jgi:acyl-CoA thioester hydrolase
MGKMSQYRFFIELSVRFRDLDAMGHVNNSVFLTYFEEVRTYYLQETGKIDFSQDGPGFILAEMLCRYRSAAKFGERLKIYCRTAELGRSSFVFTYEIREANSERLVAEGRSVQVAYDYKTNKSIPLPDQLRQNLSSYEELPMET